MGREIKKVAPDFNWPINVVWKGYINPYRATECKVCGGSGLNTATKKLDDDWYSFDKPEQHAGWQYRLEQADVKALVKAGRLMNFTHRPRTPEQAAQLKKDGGYWLKESNGYMPTAEEVNNWARNGGGLSGHDSINRWICVKARARRLKIWGLCPLCDGNGSYFCSPKYAKLSDKWESIEPPEGEAFQVWETVSEGAPISPPFLKAEDLADWCANQSEEWFHRNSSKEDWLKFILGPGWCPTMTTNNGVMKEGIQSVI